MNDDIEDSERKQVRNSHSSREGVLILAIPSFPVWPPHLSLLLLGPPSMSQGPKCRPVLSRARGPVQSGFGLAHLNSWPCTSSTEGQLAIGEGEELAGGGEP